MKKAKLFRTGGSYAVRIPKEWVPVSEEVVIRREGNRIIVSEVGADLRELAQAFAAEGMINISRPEQPITPKAPLL